MRPLFATFLAIFAVILPARGQPAHELVYGWDLGPAQSDRNEFLQGPDGAYYGTSFGGGAYGQGCVYRMTSTGELRTLVSFSETVGPHKGANPVGRLALGNDGNFYGMTTRGGLTDFGYGTIFKLTPAGSFTTLVEFTYDDVTNKGAYPAAGLALGSDGNFYGTTAGGGAHGDGTIFKLTPAGALTTLVQFILGDPSLQGAKPTAALTRSNDGNFYGTTNRGGMFDKGTFFRVTPAGQLTKLVDFPGFFGSTGGRYPSSELLLASDGNFYGTTERGGAGDFGTIFKVTSAGLFTTVLDFTFNGAGNKGAYPTSGLSRGMDGNFYGTTNRGGVSDFGTYYKVTPAGSLTTFFEFTQNGATNRGSRPNAGMTAGSDGSFYGTTVQGGGFGKGTTFKVAPDGTLTTLVEFTPDGASRAGRSPAGLVSGNDGNFYGTTLPDVLSGYASGTIFKVTPAGVLTTLVAFTGTAGDYKGYNPYGGLTTGSDSNFYGTTQKGGAGDLGTIFKVTPGGILTTLAEFTGNGTINKGSYPPGGLTPGSDGNFYGTTERGGTLDYGTVFKVTPGGTLTTLVHFTSRGVSNKGAFPTGGLTAGSDGNFYGTTQRGGTSDFGTVFKMTPSGALTTLAEFSVDDANNPGRYPVAGLTAGPGGNFYGTTSQGGATDDGTVFRITSAGVLTTLLEFSNNGASNKGAQPYARLTPGTDENLYGTTRLGGPGNHGTVFQMTPAGVLTTLVEFTGIGTQDSAGANPGYGALVLHSDGNFYGTTQNGGPGGGGTIFRVRLVPALIDDWRQTWFGTPENAGNAADDADPNNNGIPNLLEYALGGDPAAFSRASVLPQPGVDSTTQCLEFHLIGYPKREDLTSAVQAADTLAGPWLDLARSVSGGAFTVLAAGATATESVTGSSRTVTVCDVYPAPDPEHPRRFLRLKVTRL